MERYIIVVHPSCVAVEQVCCVQEKMRMYRQTCDSMDLQTAISMCWLQMLLKICGDKENYLMPSSQTVGKVSFHAAVELTLDCVFTCSSLWDQGRKAETWVKKYT